MKWTVKIGRLFGIDVKMHLTFLLLIGWVMFMYLNQGQSLASAIMGVLFLLAIFMCVILHEFGHSLTARKFGIKTRDIVLLPIGGVARLEKMPSNPLQELWVALAGPAVNIGIATVLFIYLKMISLAEPSQALTTSHSIFLERVMIVNIFIVAFNMLPAFPMDGGRVLRAIMATRLDYGKATQIAASIGQTMAVILGIIGLFYNPLLILVAVFVWIGAAQEANLASLQSALGGVPVRQAMLTNFNTLDGNDTLDRAVELTLAGSQKDFPVVADGRVEGILTQADLMKALAERDKHSSVRTAMQQNFSTIESLDMLETAVVKLKECDCNAIPVTLNRKLVGLLTMDNLGEFMRIRAASTA
ncbi:MAG: site-2 protease family protein [Desulfobacterales bacterium]|jgi:Zn-dependent protease